MIAQPIKTIVDIYPLSPAQQGMLFHSLYAPGSGVYVEQMACTLRGPLNGVAFEQAWQQVVDRYTILRTAFNWDSTEQPLQVVRRTATPPWDYCDWRGCSPEEQEARLTDYLKNDRERGFDLMKAPLLRLALAQMAEDRFVFIWTHHHLLLDGWSLSLVLKDVLLCYEALRRGQSWNPQPPQPYRMYISWLQQQNLGLAEAFWRNLLQGFSAPTRLSVDLAPDEQSGPDAPHDEQQIMLSAELSQALHALGRRCHLTPGTLIQGAWALLLHHYSREHDLVFGVTVSGRPAELPDVETMVGPFINTLPTRVQIRPEVSLLTWLQQLQAQMAELRQFEYSPLVQVQGWSDVPRDQPLFSSIVVVENYPLDMSLREQSGSLQISDLRLVERTNYPLTLIAKPGQQLTLGISADRHHFAHDTTARMLGHLEQILASMAANIQQPLSEVSLVTDAERQQTLEQWHRPHIAAAPGRCLHSLFEAQVAQTPLAVAAVFEQERVTYHELNMRANQVAHHLRALGVQPGSLVGVCMERSLELLIGILGILKAGAAYLPLDIAYPSERLQFMLDDAQIAVLLTQSQLRPVLPAEHVQIVCLDQWDVIGRQSTINPPTLVGPDNLAYVIYTSGSTGKPKGTPVSHANVARLFSACQPWFNFGPEDVWTLFHSHAFDFSVWEIWGALLYGGRLVVVPFWVSRSPESFAALLVEQQVTVLNQTPSAFRQLIQLEERAGALTGLALRLVIFGGEALEFSTLQPWFARHGDARPQLVNMYGITETTVHVTYRPLTQADAERAQASNIGRPIPDLQVYVLDPYLHPAPVGVAGELHVGGAGLAWGYLNRADLTAERFVPHPFSATPGQRLYRTGDLARLQADGLIEYLGRIDQQVKIRGFRIELGEIEAVLNQHPAVRESVVQARPIAQDEAQLVAYVVTATAVSASELGGFMKTQLPGYMVPTVFIMLDALPLTTNGKVNYRVLPAPTETRPTLEVAYVAPQTELERAIAGVWQAVLQLETIGRDDNFFDLGGHSLRMIQVQNKLREALARDIPMVDLFTYPSIAGLAHYLSRAPDEAQHAPQRQSRAVARHEGLSQQRQTRQRYRSTSGPGDAE